MSPPTRSFGEPCQGSTVIHPQQCQDALDIRLHRSKSAVLKAHWRAVWMVLRSPLDFSSTTPLTTQSAPTTPIMSYHSDPLQLYATSALEINLTPATPIPIPQLATTTTQDTLLNSPTDTIHYSYEQLHQMANSRSVSPTGTSYSPLSSPRMDFDGYTINTPSPPPSLTDPLHLALLANLPTTAEEVLDSANASATKSHARRRPNGHVPRPRNAFILFRSESSNV